MIYELKATKRDVFGKKLAKSREAGLVPAVIYGTELKENINIFLIKNELIKVYDKAGTSSLINLNIEGESKPHEVLIKDIGHDPVKGDIIHIDFYQIKRGQKLEVEVALNFTGLAPVVKLSGGILIKNLNTIKIKCLPEEILAEVAVDLSNLNAFEDKIYVRDLGLPATVEILQDLNDVVVSVSAPIEEDFATPKAAVAEAAPVEGAVVPVVEEKDKEKEKKK